MRWGDILCGCLMFAMGGFALWMLIGMLRDKIGFTERFSDRTTAWLASTKRVEAIYTRNHGIFRHAIDAKYEYMVEGRKYTRAHRFFDTTFSGVPRKATVVYQKKRPERAYYIKLIEKEDPRYYMLYQIRPGVTSYATLYNGYTDTMEKMLIRLQYDLDYLEHRSWSLDMTILLKTFFYIAFGKNF